MFVNVSVNAGHTGATGVSEEDVTIPEGVCLLE